MKPEPRHFLALVALSTVALLSPGTRAQEAWPAKRVTFLVGFAPGGFADSVGRIIATKLGQRLKQTFIVQNMDGAGGNTAARQVSVTAPDGYTFLVTTTGIAINETLYKNKGYNISSLIPVSIPVSAPEGLMSNPRFGIKTFPDLIAAAKEGRAYMGTAGIGSGSHIAAEYFFKNVAKIEVKHIPFGGGAPALQALLTGDINVRAATVSVTTIGPVNRGELVGLGVAAEKRDPAIPNVPTFAELGYPGFYASSWVGVFAPAGTPEEILAKLNSEINGVMREPDVLKQMEALSLLVTERDQPGTAKYFASEILNWSAMVKATGLSM